MHQLYLPITVITGADTSVETTVVITAGVHGAELPPIAAAQRVIEEVDETTVSGRLIVVPVANPASFKQQTPFVNPIDSKNLNRTFPGKEHGSSTEKLAFTLCRDVLRFATHHIDCHAADTPQYIKNAYAGFYHETEEYAEATEVTLQMAQYAAANLGLVIRFNGNIHSGYLAPNEDALYCSAHSFKQGVPAIDIECENALTSTPIVHEALENTLRGLGVLPGRVLQQSNLTVIKRRCDVIARQPGYYHPHLESGDYVKKGDEIGVLLDKNGQRLETYHAPQTGTILISWKKGEIPEFKEGNPIEVIGISVAQIGEDPNNPWAE